MNIHAEYVREARQFLRQKTRARKGAGVTNDELYTAFEKWWKQKHRGFTVPTRSMLFGVLSREGKYERFRFRVQGRVRRGWSGLVLK